MLLFRLLHTHTEADITLQREAVSDLELRLHLDVCRLHLLQLFPECYHAVLLLVDALLQQLQGSLSGCGKGRCGQDSNLTSVDVETYLFFLSY